MISKFEYPWEYIDDRTDNIQWNYLSKLNNEEIIQQIIDYVPNQIIEDNFSNKKLFKGYYINRSNLIPSESIIKHAHYWISNGSYKLVKYIIKAYPDYNYGVELMDLCGIGDTDASKKLKMIQYLLENRTEGCSEECIANNVDNLEIIKYLFNNAPKYHPHSISILTWTSYLVDNMPNEGLKYVLQNSIGSPIESICNSTKIKPRLAIVDYLLSTKQDKLCRKYIENHGGVENITSFLDTGPPTTLPLWDIIYLYFTDKDFGKTNQFLEYIFLDNILQRIYLKWITIYMHKNHPKHILSFTCKCYDLKASNSKFVLDLLELGYLKHWRLDSLISNLYSFSDISNRVIVKEVMRSLNKNGSIDLSLTSYLIFYHSLFNLRDEERVKSEYSCTSWSLDQFINDPIVICLVNHFISNVDPSRYGIHYYLTESLLSSDRRAFHFLLYNGYITIPPSESEFIYILENNFTDFNGIKVMIEYSVKYSEDEYNEGIYLLYKYILYLLSYEKEWTTSLSNFDNTIRKYMEKIIPYHAPCLPEDIYTSNSNIRRDFTRWYRVSTIIPDKNVRQEKLVSLLPSLCQNRCIQSIELVYPLYVDSKKYDVIIDCIVSHSIDCETTQYLHTNALPFNWKDPESVKDLIKKERNTYFTLLKQYQVKLGNYLCDPINVSNITYSIHNKNILLKNICLEIAREYQIVLNLN